MTEIEYALRLESLFGRFYATRCLLADDFRYNPTETIQQGIGWIFTKGLIPNGAYEDYLVDYNFGQETLREVLTNADNECRLNQLVKELENLTIE